MKELEEIRELLKKPLNTEVGNILASQLAECESWSAYISQQYRDAVRTLNEMEGKLFNPSLSSEDKRKIDLRSNVREFQHDADVLGDLQDILKRRISLGQTILRSVTKEVGLL